MMLLLEQAQELNRNNQILLGVEKGITPRVEMVEEPITPPVEEVVPPQENPGEPGEEGTPASQEEAPPAETTGTEERRGFWGRLFRGKKK